MPSVALLRSGAKASSARGAESVSALPVLSQIFVYPIKSARGIAVDEAWVEARGPARDRRWMLVDDAGLFLSQRRFPTLALLTPRFEGDDLVVEAPAMPPLRIRRWSGEGDWVCARVWHDELKLPNPDRAYDEWFTSYLGQSCRLVHLPDHVVRPVEAPYTQERVSLADGFPLLVMTQASLDLLNQKLAEPVTINRFRPNLVIAGSAAHEEDGWRRVRIGEVELAVVKPCARCSIPNVNQDTAEIGVEPLQTLARYRISTRNGKPKLLFAQNALVTIPGLLRRGLTVELLPSE